MPGFFRFTAEYVRQTSLDRLEICPTFWLYLRGALSGLLAVAGAGWGLWFLRAVWSKGIQSGEEWIMVVLIGLLPVLCAILCGIFSAKCFLAKSMYVFDRRLGLLSPAGNMDAIKIDQIQAIAVSEDGPIAKPVTPFYSKKIWLYHTHVVLRNGRELRLQTVDSAQSPDHALYLATAISNFLGLPGPTMKQLPQKT